MVKCKRHKWRVGAFIGGIDKKKIVKKGIHIWCERCNKRIKAYYFKPEETIKRWRKR